METIRENLPLIAEAGFTTIQTSPMQPQKDYYSNGNWRGEWWKLYQPLGLSVATKNNALGTKDDLIALCEEAERYNIKIIVDVVSNHLGGGSSESFNSGVQEYEPEIYENNLLHQGVGLVNDNNLEQLVRGHLGDYPDLATENPIVQNAVLDLLKEYVDCGVSGFRFDAAKHIETSYDGEYASNYWNYVLSNAETYAEETYGKTLYYYGEILNTPGLGRDIRQYVELMDVTDNVASARILDCVENNDPSVLVDEDFYNYELPSHSLVLWGESHDTYANDSHETTYIVQSEIDKAYAVAASFNNTTALYFVRPEEQTILGARGSDNFLNPAIKNVNDFHNNFLGSENEISANGSYFINYKENETARGFMLIDFDEGNNNVSLSNVSLPDGNYLDSLSGNLFTVNEGQLEGTMDSSGIATLYNLEDYEPTPIIRVSDDGSSIHSAPFSLTIEVMNAEEAFYQIDGGERVYFEDETTLLLGEGIEEGNITLFISARNGENVVEREFIYRFGEENPLLLTVDNIPEEQRENRRIYAWVWGGENGSRFVNGTLNNDSFSFLVAEDDTNFLLATFTENTTNPSWDLCLSQTDDQTIILGNVYDGNNFQWRNH